MKQLDLSPFTVNVMTPKGRKDLPYLIKENLADLIFSRDLKLSAKDILERSDLARAILAADETLLLEEPQYAVVRKAIETFTGFGRPDETLIRRVLDAPTVEPHTLHAVPTA